jgi:hypothetical protein
MRSALLALLLLPAAAFGEFAMMEDPVPINRLIANTEKALQKSPKDAALHFQLARLYSMRFAGKMQSVYVHINGDRKLPADERLRKDAHISFAPYQGVRMWPTGEIRKLTAAELKDLKGSLREYEKATALDPKNAIAKLGYGWMLELAAPYGGQVGNQNFRASAAKTYRALFALSKPIDLQKTMSLSLPDDYPAREAAESLLRLFTMGIKPNPGEERELQAHIKAIDAKPKAITPIIFRLSEGPLVNSTARVSFDLVGDNIKRQWPWITPNAAFLAWDPKGTGKIESGRQLFGNSTFWMMYRDGYQALRSLDDNLDGWLTGRELKGIVAWRDRNENARSDKGEVAPVAALGITAIRVRADGFSDGMLSSRQGLRLATGGYLPTYDWKPTSLR